MNILYHYGDIRTTMAYLIGYSGETKESLETNLNSLKQFMSMGDILERVYFSKAVPFRGTVWGNEIENNEQICS